MGWLWMLAACGGLPGTSTPETELTVLAASSLSESFEQLATRYEALHPGHRVTLAFAGTQSLALQIQQGLDADVFASADSEYAERLHEQLLVDTPRTIAKNSLVLAVRDADERVAQWRDLHVLDRLVVGAETVPVGRYTTRLIDESGAHYGTAWKESVEASIVSREPNVRLAAAKVALGEADGAVVYATDTQALDGLRGIAPPAPLAFDTTVVHARILGSSERKAADQWMGFVESVEGQAILEDHGFRARTRGTP